MFLSFLWLLFSIFFTTFVKASKTACSAGIPASLASELGNYKPAASYCASSFPAAVETVDKIYPPRTITSVIVTTNTIASDTVTLTETALPIIATLTESDTVTSVNIATIISTSTSWVTQTSTTTLVNDATVTNTVTDNFEDLKFLPQITTVWTTVTTEHNVLVTSTVTTITSTVTKTATPQQKRDIVQAQVFSELLALGNNGSATLSSMCRCMARTSTKVNSIISTRTVTTYTTVNSFVTATETSRLTPVVDTTLTAFTTSLASSSTYSTLILYSTTVTTAVETSTTTITETATLDVTSTITGFLPSIETQTSTVTASTTSVVPVTAHETKTVWVPVVDPYNCGGVYSATGSLGSANPFHTDTFKQFIWEYGLMTNSSTCSGNWKITVTPHQYFAPYFSYYPVTTNSCAATQLCATAAVGDPGYSWSFDLHYLTDIQQWECIRYYEVSSPGDWSVQNPNVYISYGFNVVLP